MIECCFREFRRTKSDARIIGEGYAFLGYTQEIAIDLLIAVFIMVALHRVAAGWNVRNDDEHGAELGLGLPGKGTILPQECVAWTHLRMDQAFGVADIIQLDPQWSCRNGLSEKCQSGGINQNFP